MSEKIEGQGGIERDYKKADGEPIDKWIDSLKKLEKTEAVASSGKLPEDSVVSSFGQFKASDRKPEVPQIPTPLNVGGPDGLDGVRMNPWLNNLYALLAIIIREWAMEQMKSKFKEGQFKAKHTTAVGKFTQMRAETTIKIGQQAMILGVLNGAISGLNGLISLKGAGTMATAEGKAATKYDEQTTKMQHNPIYEKKPNPPYESKEAAENKKNEIQPKLELLERNKAKTDDKIKKYQERLEDLDRNKQHHDNHQVQERLDLLHKQDVDKYQKKLNDLQPKGPGSPEYIRNEKKIAKYKEEIGKADDFFNDTPPLEVAYKEYKSAEIKFEDQQKKSLDLQNEIEEKKNDPDLPYIEKKQLDTGTHELDGKLAASQAKAEKYREKMDKYAPGINDLKKLMEHQLELNQDQSQPKYEALKTKQEEMQKTLSTRPELRLKTIGEESMKTIQYQNTLNQGINQILSALKELSTGYTEAEKQKLVAEEQLEQALVTIASQGKEATQEHIKQFSDQLSEIAHWLNQMAAGQTKISEIKL